MIALVYSENLLRRSPEVKYGKGWIGVVAEETLFALCTVICPSSASLNVI